MNCGQARNLSRLNSVSDTAFSPEVLEAKRHVKNCPECTEFFERENRLRAFINERAPREKVPASLREKILRSIAIERTAHQRWALAGLTKRSAVALTVLIGVIALLAFFSVVFFKVIKPGQSLSISELIDDHIRSISEEADISSSDPETVESWFKGKVNFLVRIPRLRDAKLVGGRLCFLRKWPAALLYYQIEHNPLSLFILEGSSLDLSSLGKIKAGDKELYYGSRKGCSLVLWDERGLIYAVISDMKEEELVHLISAS